MRHRQFLKDALVMGALPLAAAETAPTSDGQPHGDPPFLLEIGWQPLLAAGGLAGWMPPDGKPSTWTATRAVLWDPAAAPKKLTALGMAGDRILNGPEGRTANLVTTRQFGDMELYLEFMIPEGSNSGVYLHGLYEVQIFDSFGAAARKTSDCGAIYHRWINEKPVGGSPPKVNASYRPGQWQSFQIWFRGPRFDTAGEKLERTRFLRVLHNGVLVQENVELLMV